LADSSRVYTASFGFFEAIYEVWLIDLCNDLLDSDYGTKAGVTHCFVNLGSDHPSIIEAIVKGQNEKNGKFPRIITCPNEVRTRYLSNLNFLLMVTRWSLSV
jgi:hypothetical protein